MEKCANCGHARRLHIDQLGGAVGFCTENTGVGSGICYCNKYREHIDWPQGPLQPQAHPTASLPEATAPPKFQIGERIASGLYAGKIEAAFFFGEQWNYCIGQAASVRPVQPGSTAHETGPKYIKEGDVKWKWNEFTNYRWVKCDE